MVAESSRRWSRPGIVLLAAALTIWPGTGRAAEPESPDTMAVETARLNFTEGNVHFQARRWAEALQAFEASASLVASPNTSLMMARCLRELGRRPDAANAFASAASEAQRRAGNGESKYAPTLEAATKEGAAVRAQLGTIRVRVAHPLGAKVTVDKQVVPLSNQGDAQVLHDPASVTVTVNDGAGHEQRQTVTVQAGATVEMAFAGSGAGESTPLEPSRPTRPESPKNSGSPWTVPTFIAGGVTLVGLGAFVGFGMSSQSAYDELAGRCGPNACGPNDRALADDGKRDQTFANIGLGVSVVAAAATVVFGILSMSSDDKTASQAPWLPTRRIGTR